MNPLERFRSDDTERIQRAYQRTAMELGRVLIMWYEETGEIPNIKSHMRWEDTGDDGTWDTGKWHVIINQPGLGDVDVPIR